MPVLVWTMAAPKGRGAGVSSERAVKAASAVMCSLSCFRLEVEAMSELRMRDEGWAMKTT